MSFDADAPILSVIDLRTHRDVRGGEYRNQCSIGSKRPRYRLR